MGSCQKLCIFAIYMVSIAVIGLGYVGLSLVKALEGSVRVIAYDIDVERIAELGKESRDQILFTSDEKKLADATTFIIAVPTPLDRNNEPDLTALKFALQSIGRNLKKNDIVIVESSVYPGCSEEVCIPMLEEISGLKHIRDFGIGSSPERINPGDELHTIEKVVKVIAAGDEQTLDHMKWLYGDVVGAPLHVAPSIKVCEASKLVENIQRDVNIALMNELNVALDAQGIDLEDVLAAAATKWNFASYHPGLVGGSCVGVNSRYMEFASKKAGFNHRLMTVAREINDDMPRYYAMSTAQKVSGIKNPKILIVGKTYKANVTDVRNSRVPDLIAALASFGITDITVYDPLVDGGQQPDLSQFDDVIVAVRHKGRKQ